MNGDRTIFCTICGSMSKSDASAESHFMQHHSGADWVEDPVMVRFAMAMFRAEEEPVRVRIMSEISSG